MSSDEPWVEKTLAGMSLARRVAQMVTVGIEGGYLSDDDPRFQHGARLARELGVGGFVVYGGTPRDIARLLNRLQAEAAVPLLMSSDFEGGPGQQAAGASEFPGDMALSAVGAEELAYRVATIGATEGRAMGIHLTYSPVADVSVDPGNPAESVRSFGGDLDLLGRLIAAYIRGYQENGMLATAKHFPGRGDVQRLANWPPFTYIAKPAAQVEAQEFRAFSHAIAAGVACVMTEHVAVPSVTGGSELPASVEPALATGWLREKLGFSGILSSDDLWYDFVVQRFGAEEVAVKAIQAGHDVLLKPRDPDAAVERVVRAVESGEIPRERIDESVRKLLSAKARLSLHRERFTDESRLGALVGTTAHLAVVQELADRSLTLLRNDGVLPVASASLKQIVNLSFQKAESDPSPATLAGKLSAAFPGTQSLTIRPEMESEAYERALRLARSASLVVLSLFVPRDRIGDPAPLRGADQALIRRILSAKPGAVIAMSYGNPFLVERLEGVPAFAVGYGEKGWFGNQAVYFESFVKLLRGELRPQGRLPVKVSSTFPIGSGIRG
ncbi:MAG TPA: glycoside hydrolase family 3 N-terminal domain-containing protein [Spirochaetia bacterium]|nr:glycoside hydrolase family 3 N-terminal domain-containing protein [Spirochaetia bacterium]